MNSHVADTDPYKTVTMAIIYNELLISPWIRLTDMRFWLVVRLLGPYKPLASSCVALVLYSNETLALSLIYNTLF